MDRLRPAACTFTPDTAHITQHLQCIVGYKCSYSHSDQVRLIYYSVILCTGVPCYFSLLIISRVRCSMFCLYGESVSTPILSSAASLYLSARALVLSRPADLMTSSQAVSTSPARLNLLRMRGSSWGNSWLANKTGPVARPRPRSATLGLPGRDILDGGKWGQLSPNRSPVEVKSSKSSMSWKEIPIFFPNSKAFSFCNTKQRINTTFSQIEENLSPESTSHPPECPDCLQTESQQICRHLRWYSQFCCSSSPNRDWTCQPCPSFNVN